MCLLYSIGNDFLSSRLEMTVKPHAGSSEKTAVISVCAWGIEMGRGWGRQGVVTFVSYICPPCPQLLYSSSPEFYFSHYVYNIFTNSFSLHKSVFTKIHPCSQLCLTYVLAKWNKPDSAVTVSVSQKL